MRLSIAQDRERQAEEEVTAAYHVCSSMLGASAACGYLSEAEAEQHGLSGAVRAYAEQIGAITRVVDGVLRLTSVPPSLFDRLALSWLTCAPGGVVSHESALALHGLLDPGDEMHLSHPPKAAARSASGVVLHAAPIAAKDRTWRNGLPVTTLARTLKDCAAAGTSPAVLEPVMRVAQRRKLVPPPKGAPKPPAVRDPRLRLALLEELVPFAELSPLSDKPKVLAKWAAKRELPEEELGSAITDLSWDGGEILSAVAGSDAPVEDLTGLERYTALRVLDLPASRIGSLEPIRALEDLVAVFVAVTPATSLEPLLALPALRRVVLSGADDAAHGGVLRKLAGRGVVVDHEPSPGPLPCPPVRDPIFKLALLEALMWSGVRRALHHRCRPSRVRSGWACSSTPPSPTATRQRGPRSVVGSSSTASRCRAAEKAHKLPPLGIPGRRSGCLGRVPDISR